MMIAFDREKATSEVALFGLVGAAPPQTPQHATTGTQEDEMRWTRIDSLD